jgi:predicted nuclease with TOPRIM domain
MLTRIDFDADKGDGGGGGETQPETNTEQKAEETFETFLEKQDAKVKELYKTHTSGLKSALNKERDEKKLLSTQLKELLPKAEKGSDLEKQLSETLTKMEAAEKRASFVEQAIKPEIGCVNVKAAYALALADDLFDRNGRPDWTEIKKTAPELFRKAGSTDGGAGGETPPANDINAAIRRATGR